MAEFSPGCAVTLKRQVVVKRQPGPLIEATAQPDWPGQERPAGEGKWFVGWK